MKQQQENQDVEARNWTFKEVCLWLESNTLKSFSALPSWLNRAHISVLEETRERASLYTETKVW